MSDLTPSPAELLAKRLADIELSRSRVTAAQIDAALTKQRAFNRAGLLAIRVVKSAAAAGNVQCKKAEVEIDAFLQILNPKPE